MFNIKISQSLKIKLQKLINKKGGINSYSKQIGISSKSIEKEKRINISQKNKECLITLKNKIKETFDIDSIISKDKEAWKLRINNAPFTTYLMWRYKLHTGKKFNTVRTPKIIFKLSQKHKISFLAGYLEGDGCFSHYWRETKRARYKVPRIFITSSSFKMIEDLQKLFDDLKLISKINQNIKPINHKWSQTYKLNILKIEDCLKLAYLIQPFLLHPERKEKLKEIFKDPGLLNCFRIKNRGPLIKLVNHLKLARKELPSYFLKNLNYKTFTSTINGWINGAYDPPFINTFTLLQYS
jgi:hypothetical protein